MITSHPMIPNPEVDFVFGLMSRVHLSFNLSINESMGQGCKGKRW